MPPDTYNVTFNAPNGNEYEEIIPYSGTGGTAVSNYSMAPVVTVTATLVAGNYQVIIGNSGD